MDLGGKGAIKAIGSRIGAWFEDQDQHGRSRPYVETYLWPIFARQNSLE